eukprot:scaffold17158_cov66-Phaeocystis_antarctica.AAC.3
MTYYAKSCTANRRAILRIRYSSYMRRRRRQGATRHARVRKVNPLRFSPCPPNQMILSRTDALHARRCVVLVRQGGGAGSLGAPTSARPAHRDRTLEGGRPVPETAVSGRVPVSRLSGLAVASTPPGPRSTHAQLPSPGTREGAGACGWGIHEGHEVHSLPRDDAAAEHVWVLPQGPLGPPAPPGLRVEPRGARAGRNRARRVAQAVPGGEAHRTKMGDVHAERAPGGPHGPRGPVGHARRARRRSKGRARRAHRRRCNRVTVVRLGRGLSPLALLTALIPAVFLTIVVFVAVRPAFSLPFKRDRRLRRSSRNATGGLCTQPNTAKLSAACSTTVCTNFEAELACSW